MSTIGAGSEAGKSKQDDSTQSEVMSTKAQESYRAGKEQARQQKKLQKLEASITEAENNMQQLKDRLMDPALASDYVKLQEIQDEIDALEEEILSMMEEYDRIGS